MDSYNNNQDEYPSDYDRSDSDDSVIFGEPIGHHDIPHMRDLKVVTNHPPGSGTASTATSSRRQKEYPSVIEGEPIGQDDIPHMRDLKTADKIALQVAAADDKASGVNLLNEASTSNHRLGTGKGGGGTGKGGWPTTWEEMRHVPKGRSWAERLKPRHSRSK